jgi:hypothetical protein
MEDGGINITEILQQGGNIMMKKTIVVGLLIFALSLPSIGRAATVGNVAETQGALGKFSLGLEYDGVFNRDMDWKSGSMSVTALGVTTTEPRLDPGESIEDMEVDSNRIFLKGTLGLHPNVDIFVKLGMADANSEYKWKESGFPDEKIEFEDDWDFAWGVGAKVKIFETPGGLRFMADGQYLSYEVDGDIKVDGQDFDQGLLEELQLLDPTATFSSDSKTEIEEWQVALYVNQTFGNFSPYAGVKYSEFDVDFELKGSGQLFAIPYSLKLDEESEADDNFGVFVGTDIYIIPNQLSLNIEARFIDETAGTFGVNYRF